MWACHEPRKSVHGLEREDRAIAVATMLLEAGATPQPRLQVFGDPPDPDQYSEPAESSALHKAARWSERLVMLLLQRGADPCIELQNGDHDEFIYYESSAHAPIVQAARASCVETFTRLLATMCARVHPQGYPHGYAQWSLNRQLVQSVWQSCVYLKVESATRERQERCREVVRLGREYASSASFKTAEKYVEYARDLYRALQYASFWNPLVVCDLLAAGVTADPPAVIKFSNGTRPWPAGGGPLTYPADYFHLGRITGKRNRQSPTAHWSEHTALHFAAGGGNSDSVTLLLASGSNVNALNLARNTPLHSAAFVGSVDCVRALLAAGASINAVNHAGSTPLAIAVSDPRRHVDVTLALLSAGAEPSVRDASGRTALDRAAGSSRLSAVGELLPGDERARTIREALRAHRYLQ